MTLSQIIKLRTNNGRNVIDFLIDVMHDRYEDFSICHRLQAARLLTTYGNEEASSFIDDNPRPRTARRNSSKSKHQTMFDTELARVIKQDTRDGRSVAYFLIEVMEGGRTEFRPHHRISAARELLDRGFGKSALKESTEVDPATRRSGEGTSPRTTIRGRNPETSPSTDIAKADPTVHPDPVEGHSTPTNEITQIPESDEPSKRLAARQSQFRQPPAVPAEAGTQRRQGQEALTPHSSPLTPNQIDILDTLTHISPDHFEHTVLELLENMGYGDAKRLGRTGDGGIDGIIDRNEDYFELDTIYVQAKRWTGPVGEPEIRNFSGSLDPHAATRGIFITTSDFTDSARKTASAISAGTKRIRLINGPELAHLVHHHNVQVTPNALQDQPTRDPP